MVVLSATDGRGRGYGVRRGPAEQRRGRRRGKEGGGLWGLRIHGGVILDFVAGCGDYGFMVA